MKAKLPYLKELGVKLVWVASATMAGDRFYGLWSCYANIDPSKVEPTLGTEAELKGLIEAAHAHGIKVILDWQTSGAENGTELTRARPELFFEWDATDGMAVQGKNAWGMQNYRWDGDAWREWYVSTAVDMITKFGFDGFRVDSGFDAIASMVNKARNFPKDKADAVLNGSISAWMEIAEKVPHALVMPETLLYCPYGEAYAGHMTQHDSFSGMYPYGDNPHPFPWKGIPSQPRCHQTVQISVHDSRPGLNNQRSLIGYYIWSQFVPVILSGDEFDTPFGPAVPWAKTGANLAPYGHGEPMDCPANYSVKQPKCWPYAVPVQWDHQEKQGSPGQTFSQDIQSMIAVQEANLDLLHKSFCRSNVMAAPNATALPHVPDPDRALPPYIRYSGAGEGVLVVANPQHEDPSLSASFVFNLTELLRPGSGFMGARDSSGLAEKEGEGDNAPCMNVTTLWGAPTKTHTDVREVGGNVVVCGAAAERFIVSVGADRRPGGGIAAYRLAVVERS